MLHNVFTFLLVTLITAALAAAPEALAAADGQNEVSSITPTIVDISAISAKDLHWRKLAPGLELLELKLQTQHSDNGQLQLTPAPVQAGEHADLALLRSDPAQVEYTLHMASEDGLRESLQARARRHGLYAAINAGMYLPDNYKSTGYLRNASHTNNGRIVKNFGAFFLAGPRKSGLPAAMLLEKLQFGDKLNEKIADYDLVLQNYRLTSADKKILWPDSQETFSISALGRDNGGHIWFIVCETPLSPPDFARLILALPLKIDLLMYLEGGSQAGLTVRNVTANHLDAKGTDHPDEELSRPEAYSHWGGRHGGFNLGNLGGLNRTTEFALPNVLGVRPK